VRVLKSLSNKAGNYAATLVVLMRSFLSENGWAAYASVGFALLAGLLQPVPYAMLAHVGMVASRGETLVHMPGGISLPLNTAFYAGTAMLLLAVVLTHLADRFALYQNSADC
jgi:hypothetical protein